MPVASRREKERFRGGEGAHDDESLTISPWFCDNSATGRRSPWAVQILLSSRRTAFVGVADPQLRTKRREVGSSRGKISKNFLYLSLCSPSH